jgi:hypothetical protein
MCKKIPRFNPNSVELSNVFKDKSASHELSETPVSDKNYSNIAYMTGRILTLPLAAKTGLWSLPFPRR